MKRLVWLLFLTAVFAFCSGCKFGYAENEKTDGGEKVSVVTYNAQEFFDAVRDGCEYEEFRKSGDWNGEVYETRLKRLCQVIRAADADIYVLEEIENEAVIMDIANQLCADSWRESRLLNYSLFAKEPGSAIGIAVLSRFPLSGLRLHSLDVRTQKGAQPSVRPIIHVQADIKGRTLHLFCNHWKSKSGGEEKTEIWREWQESILAEQVTKAASGEEDFTALLCGDFNRDIKDFEISKNSAKGFGTVLLRSTDPVTGTFKAVEVISPWLDAKGRVQGSSGSYFFNGSWERIDHIFLCGKGEILSFGPVSKEDWVDEKGAPKGFRLGSGTGYSDHLPVKAVISLN